jgi:hypothetical protein
MSKPIVSVRFKGPSVSSYAWLLTVSDDVCSTGTLGLLPSQLQLVGPLQVMIVRHLLLACSEEGLVRLEKITCARGLVPWQPHGTIGTFAEQDEGCCQRRPNAARCSKEVLELQYAAAVGHAESDMCHQTSREDQILLDVQPDPARASCTFNELIGRSILLLEDEILYTFSLRSRDALKKSWGSWYFIQPHSSDSSRTQICSQSAFSSYRARQAFVCS